MPSLEAGAEPGQRAADRGQTGGDVPPALLGLGVHEVEHLPQVPGTGPGGGRGRAGGRSARSARASAGSARPSPGPPARPTGPRPAAARRARPAAGRRKAASAATPAGEVSSHSASWPGMPSVGGEHGAEGGELVDEAVAQLEDRVSIGHRGSCLPSRRRRARPPPPDRRRSRATRRRARRRSRRRPGGRRRPVPGCPTRPPAPRRRGCAGATRTARSVSTSKVTRSRWFTPMSVAPTASARSTSASSCTSTRASMPDLDGQRRAGSPSSASSSAAAISSTQSAPISPGVAHVVRADGEVLAQHRQADRGPGGDQVGGRAAEPALVGEHRQAGGAARLVLARRAPPGRGRAARAPLDGERRFTSLITPRPSAAPQRGAEPPRRRHGLAPTARGRRPDGRSAAAWRPVVLEDRVEVGRRGRSSRPAPPRPLRHHEHRQEQEEQRGDGDADEGDGQERPGLEHHRQAACRDGDDEQPDREDREGAAGGAGRVRAARRRRSRAARPRSRPSSRCRPAGGATSPTARCGRRRPSAPASYRSSRGVVAAPALGVGEHRPRVVDLPHPGLGPGPRRRPVARCGRRGGGGGRGRGRRGGSRPGRTRCRTPSTS